MRFCILGDTHFGCRNDLKLFHDHFETFYTWLFDQLEKEQINTIVQLGDLWDRRKYVNFFTLNEARRYFFDKLVEKNIKLITLVGNHDIYWRESLDVNSSSLLLQDYIEAGNVEVYQQPTMIELGGTKIDIIPWICQSNEEEIRDYISQSTADLCAGHFEIESFAMYRGVESHDGLPTSLFEKYELVLSGHYHTRSEKHNITYVGTPYEMTWQDYADPKGFHVFDTKTRKLKFTKSPFNIFVKIEYDDREEIPDVKKLPVENCFVKVVVVSKTDMYKFDSFIQKLYNRGCYEVKIVEDISEFADGEIGEDINLEDTMDVLSNYIDSIDTDADKEKIKTFMKTLYIEALNMEVA